MLFNLQRNNVACKLNKHFARITGPLLRVIIIPSICRQYEKMAPKKMAPEITLLRKKWYLKRDLKEARRIQHASLKITHIGYCQKANTITALCCLLSPWELLGPLYPRI